MYDINDPGWAAGGAELDGVNSAGIWFLRSGWVGHAAVVGADRRTIRSAPAVRDARIGQARLRRQLLAGGKVTPSH